MYTFGLNLNQYINRKQTITNLNEHGILVVDTNSFFFVFELIKNFSLVSLDLTLKCTTAP